MSKPKDGAYRRIQATWEGDEMDLLAKSQWVAKLLDGSVKQTRGSLCRIPVGRHGGKRERRYCCLGVKAICDGVEFRISPLRVKTVLSDPSFGALVTLSSSLGHEGVYSSPDFPLGRVHVTGEFYEEGQWLPLDLKYPDLTSFLTEANDQFRWSFRRIGTWIAKNL